MNINLLLEEFCHYSTYIKGLSKKTIKRYDEQAGYFLRHSHIETNEEITQRKVRDFFMYGRVDKKWKPTTFISYHMTLLVFFRWLVKNNYLEKNYIEDIEKPKLEKRLPSRLKKEEALRLLEIVYNLPYSYHYLRHRNKAIFATFIFSGLRKSELLNLKLTDIDIENLTLFVRQGKGNKDRIIPISFTHAQILKRYLKERKRLNKTCPEFFTSLNRNRGFTDSGLKLIVERIKKASGISFNIHKLRHTFATLMLEGGCDIYSLSKMMGHSDIKTTTIYLSASAEHLREQVIKHPLNKII
jgi:site-specific recombinase XerD